MNPELHVVWPTSVGDPRRPSGGNTYDRELATALEQRGVRVVAHATLRDVPDDSDVLVDGLVGLADPQAIARERDRLDVALLVHLPLSLASDEPVVAEREGEALRAATSVITTSHWCRRWLLGQHPVSSARVSVASPGATRAPTASASTHGGRILCVGPVTRAKGYDVLVEALAGLRRPGWSWRVAGATDLDPAFAHQLAGRIAGAGLTERVRFAGPLGSDEMSSTYDATDLVVVPSRLETYGMVITEALARGIPVVAADTGGVVEALGSTSTGRPGVLVRAEDPHALRVALTRWLADAAHRERLRGAALARRETLTGWSETAAQVLAALAVNRSTRAAVVTT